MNIKYIYFLFYLFVLQLPTIFSSQINNNSAVPILLAFINQDKLDIKEKTEEIACYLRSGNQFDIKLKEIDKQPETIADIEKLFDLSYLIVVFLKFNLVGDNNSLEWRVYEKCYQNGKHEIKMSKGQKVSSISPKNIADGLWQALKYQKSCFSSKLGWIERSKNKMGKTVSKIIASDYDGSNKKCISQINGIYVGLYWSPENIKPSLYCSEFNFSNVVLNHILLSGKKHCVINRPGTCIGVSISADGNRAIYCLSGKIWSCEYEAKTKKSTHRCLIFDEGNNISPKIMLDGNILYCSDSGEFSGPQICTFDFLTKKIENITKSGYCVGPAYCNLNRKIAYSKKVDGFMQLFVYEPKNKIHTQITSDFGDKIDCSWSPCGRYLVFCFQNKNISKIGIINVNLELKEKIVFITPDSQYCCCPAWSCNIL